MNRVVDDAVADRALGTIDAKQGNARRMIVVQQVVLNERVLNTVQIDRGTTANTVIENRVAIDYRLRDDSVSSLRGICVELYA